MIKVEGIIIYSKLIKDNDLFIKVLTKEDKLISGLVFGGNSSKKKIIYQVGYFIEFSLNTKNSNFISFSNACLSKPFISNILLDKFKSYALISIISLLNLSIVEGQKINGLYSSSYKILEILLNNNHWISYYCEWLFILLKIIGYEIDYKSKKNYPFFDLYDQQFIRENTENSLYFPHNLFTHSSKITYLEVNTVFEIFEKIIVKNHLDTINKKIPISFTNFKKEVIKILKDKNDK